MESRIKLIIWEISCDIVRFRCSGFTELMEESKEVAHFHDEGPNLVAQYTKGELAALWSWYVMALDGVLVNGRLQFLKKAILHGPPKVDSANALAGAYFTYQILKERE